MTATESNKSERAADFDVEAYVQMHRRIEAAARRYGRPGWHGTVDRLIADTSQISDGELNGVAHVACLLMHHSSALRHTNPDLASLFGRTGHALLTYWATRIGAARALADLEVEHWDWGEVDD